MFLSVFFNLLNHLEQTFNLFKFEISDTKTTGMEHDDGAVYNRVCVCMCACVNRLWGRDGSI